LPLILRRDFDVRDCHLFPFVGHDYLKCAAPNEPFLGVHVESDSKSL